MRRSPAAARSPRGGTPGPTRTGRSRTRRSKRWEPACTRRSDPPSSCGGTGTWAQATTASSQAGSHRLDLRSEEHTSELQSRGHLVYRLLLEKKQYQTLEAHERELQEDFRRRALAAGLGLFLAAVLALLVSLNDAPREREGPIFAA